MAGIGEGEVCPVEGEAVDVAVVVGCPEAGWWVSWAWGGGCCSYEGWEGEGEGEDGFEG